MFVQGKRYKHKTIPNYMIDIMYVGGNDIDSGYPVVVAKIVDVGALVDAYYGDEYQISPNAQVIGQYEEVLEINDKVVNAA